MERVRMEEKKKKKNTSMKLDKKISLKLRYVQPKSRKYSKREQVCIP